MDQICKIHGRLLLGLEIYWYNVKQLKGTRTKGILTIIFLSCLWFLVYSPPLDSSCSKVFEIGRCGWVKLFAHYESIVTKNYQSLHTFELWDWSFAILFHICGFICSSCFCSFGILLKADGHSIIYYLLWTGYCWQFICFRLLKIKKISSNICYILEYHTVFYIIS